MQRLNRSVLAVMAGLAVWSHTPAAEYHVAQGDPVAADTNSGTRAQPWKTIGRSLTTLKAGDTLAVHAGVYREMVMLNAKGWTFAGITAPPFPGGSSIASPIRFLAAPGEEVVIKGSDVVTGWTQHADAVWVKEDWTYNSQQVFCDGAILRQIGGVMGSILQQYWRGEDKGKGFDDMVPGSFFYDIEQKKLFVWLVEGDDPNQHLMEAGARPFLFTISVDYVHVAGFKMLHGDVGSKVNWPSVHVNGAFNVLEDCEVSWCDYIGVSLSGHNNTILRCRLNNNGNAGLAGGGWGNQLLDSQLAGNNYRHWSSGWGAGGMKIIPGAHAWIVSGCVAESNRWSDGIWFDAFNANVTIQNCLMRHNDGSGIHYEISERAIIRNNIAYENKGRGIYLSNSSDSIVLHNLCYRNGMAGIVAHGVNRPGGATADPETGYAPARNNVIWGNILMDNCHPDLCPDEPDHTGQAWSLRPELVLPDPRITSNVGCVSDYNIFYRSDGRPIPFWENWAATHYADLDDWQARTGHDRHSLIAAPRFVDLAARDFHPAPGSPAIAMVRPRMSIRQDHDGRERMYRASFLTAGPYEPPAPTRAKKPQTTDVPPALRAVPLAGATVLAADGGPLAPLVAALPALPAKPMPDGGPGIELNGIPFAPGAPPGAPPGAIVLDRQHPRVLIPVNARVKDLYVLHALLNPGTGVQSRCVIVRQDGVAIHLRWEAGRNIAPSVGAWSGALTQELSPPTPGWMQKETPQHLTDVAWEGRADATPVRLFTSAWHNQNEWLPVKEIEWVLTDESATVVILGLTGRMLE